MKMKMEKEMEKEMEMPSGEEVEMESEGEMSPEDAMEILDMADEIRADSALMAEVKALREGAKKPKSIADLKAKANEMAMEEDEED